MANYVLGEDCHAYYSATAISAQTQAAFDTAISGASEITNITDLTVNLTAKVADVTIRGSTFQLNAPSVKDGTITFESIWNTSDTAFTAIKTAWLNKTEIFFVALELAKTVTGAQGPAGNFVVVNMTRTEKIGDAVKASIELKPSSYVGWSVHS